MEEVDHGPFTSHLNKDLNQIESTSDEKDWLGMMISTKQVSALVLSERYNLNINTLRKYGRAYSFGIKVRSKSGQPPLLTESELNDISEFLANSNIDVM